MTARTLAVLAAALLLCACGEQATPQGKSAAAPAPTDAAAPDSGDGRRVFEHWCLPCHAPGKGHPGTNRLAERLGPQNAVLLERTNLVAAYVETVVRNGFQMMPPFRATEISDDELKAVAAYVAGGGGRRSAPGAQP